MTGSLPTYPEYQDSGVDWLGDIPSYWHLRRLKYIASIKTGERDTVDKKADGQYPFFVRSQKVENIDSFSFDGEAVLTAGDGAGVAKVFHYIDGKFDYHQRVYKFSDFSEITGKFFYWFFSVHLRFEAFRTTAKSTVDSLRLPMLQNFPVPVPSPDEQAAIVSFLDAAEKCIRRYIRIKQKLIALLNEQKQAIIQQAVTRGLNPDAPMKDSGVEWLGEIPEGWEVRRFKFVATITSGQIDPKAEQYRDYILIAPNHIEGGTSRLFDAKSADEQGAISGKYLVCQGQVIYSKIRPKLRKVTVAPFDCLCSADMYPITPKPLELLPEFLVILLLSEQITQFLVDASLRVAMPKVNREVLTNCWLWYPSLDEQDHIIQKLSIELSPLDRVIERSRKEIDLIREYRTRLIADVVTGKVDVRGLVFELPEQFDEDDRFLDENIAVDDDLLDEDEG